MELPLLARAELGIPPERLGSQLDVAVFADEPQCAVMPVAAIETEEHRAPAGPVGQDGHPLGAQLAGSCPALIGVVDGL